MTDAQHEMNIPSLHCIMGLADSGNPAILSVEDGGKPAIMDLSHTETQRDHMIYASVSNASAPVSSMDTHIR